MQVIPFNRVMHKQKHEFKELVLSSRHVHSDFTLGAALAPNEFRIAPSAALNAVVQAIKSIPDLRKYLLNRFTF